MMFALKRSTLYTLYCINSGLLDAPCNHFQFFLFLVRSVWYKSKQCQKILTKKSVGGFLPVSLDIVRFSHLEARQYFWLCGNKAFCETMR